MIIIMRFGENVLGPKYINIYEFWGLGTGGTNIFHCTFFVYYSK